MYTIGLQTIVPAFPEYSSSGLKKLVFIFYNCTFFIRGKLFIILLTSQRETNDVALIEIEDEFDFSKPLDLSPICLSENKVQVIINQSIIELSFLTVMVPAVFA